MKTNKFCRSSLRLIIPIAALSGTLLAGCATRRSLDVERVQGELAVLRNDPVVIADATTELREAELAVQRAESSWQRSRDSAEAEHLSYLAGKRIEIAREKSDQRIAEAEVNRLSQARTLASSNANLRGAQNAAADARAAMAASGRSQMMLQDRENQIDDLRYQLNTLKARDSERGLTLILDDVLFESDRSRLRSGATRKLSAIVTYLRRHPSAVVAIEGHTDNTTPASDSNLTLSTRRAEAVRQYLVEEGIQSDRITTRGFGEQNPLVSNATEAGRIQNRRVEVIISRRDRRLGSL